MLSGYISYTEKIYFIREVDESLPCDAYSFHTHNVYELIYFLDGNATHVIEDKKYKLNRGDLIIIRPFKYHFIQIDEPVRYERYNILFNLDRHNIDGIELLPEDLEVINISGNRIVEDIFRKLDLYYKSCDSEIFEKIAVHLLSELFYNISLFLTPSSEHTATVSSLISKALRYINDNLRELDGIEEIARYLFVSESYLFRAFKKELHQTPKKYIMGKRLLLAQKLLSSGEKPTAVCSQCGFSDYTTFYRNYTNFFGHPPSQK